jgi:crotonobetainyl-CoA:carnitine CoA-transferase CaiB-like acyl-CoA transferase
MITPTLASSCGSSASTPPSGPLAGIKVIDMTRVIAGPYGTQMLGDLGADIIKIERPGEGDDARRVGPPWAKEPTPETPGESTYFIAANRNKRSLTLDFSIGEAREILLRLLKNADVLVENYRPGTLSRYGLGYDDLIAINPRLIYCSVTGFGQNGPYSPRSGYDFLIQGMGGVMTVTGYADDEPGGGPMRVGIPIADIMSGMNAVIGILAALQHRNETDEGQHVDICLFESQLAALLNTSSAWLNAGTRLGRTGNDHPSAAPYGVYEVDDGHIIIATFNDREFTRLANVLGHSEWLEDPRFIRNGDRVHNRPGLKAAVQAALWGKSRAEWIQILNDAQVSAGPINDVGDLEQDPQVAFRELLVTTPTDHLGDVRSFASPIRLSASPCNYRLGPPSLGQHSHDILRELGYLPEQIETYAKDGII